MLEIREQAGGVEIPLQVRPRSRHPGVGGVRSGALQVRVSDAPEDGRANEAVRAALAIALQIRKADVELIGGLHARRKRVRLRGDPALLRARLESLAAI